MDHPVCMEQITDEEALRRLSHVMARMAPPGVPASVHRADRALDALLLLMSQTEACNGVITPSHANCQTEATREGVLALLGRLRELEAQVGRYQRDMLLFSTGARA